MNILREREVVSRTKRSRVTLWRYERQGNFPQRIRLGPNAIGWIEAEVDAWIASRRRGPLSYEDRNLNRSEVSA
jgi:prophage regulatory protein